MYDGLSEKQIRERIRHLSDKIEALWEKIGPDIQEFNNIQEEFAGLYLELNRRGLLYAASQQNNVTRENTE